MISFQFLRDQDPRMQILVDHRAILVKMFRLVRMLLQADLQEIQGLVSVQETAVECPDQHLPHQHQAEEVEFQVPTGEEEAVAPLLVEVEAERAEDKSKKIIWYDK